MVIRMVLLVEVKKKNIELPSEDNVPILEGGVNLQQKSRFVVINKLRLSQKRALIEWVSKKHIHAYIWRDDWITIRKNRLEVSFVRMNAVHANK